MPGTRHVTLMITNQAGATSRTFDDYLPDAEAIELIDKVTNEVHVPGGGRHITLHAPRPGCSPLRATVEADDSAADKLTAWMIQRMRGAAR